MLKHKILLIFLNFIRYCTWVVKEFLRTQCSLHAASLSFKSLLAIIPFLMASLFIISSLPIFDQWQEKFQNFILNTAIPNVNSDVIIKYIHQLTLDRHALPITAAFGLFIVITLMLRTIEMVLNNIWEVDKQRPIVRALSTYLVVIIASPLLLLAGMTVTTYILTLQWVDKLSLGYAVDLLAYLPMLFNMIAFICVQWLLPYKHIPFKHVIVGAIFFGITFEVLKTLFGLYVSNLPSYQVIYGAMAIVPIFMLWVIFAWQLFLFSAIIIKGLSHWHIKTKVEDINPGKQV